MPKPLLKKTCPQCGSEFETRLAFKKYCDSNCARKFYYKKQRRTLFPSKPQKKPYVKKNPQKVTCCVCKKEVIIDNPHKEIPIFYCMSCLKKYAGKTLSDSSVVIPKFNLGDLKSVI